MSQTVIVPELGIIIAVNNHKPTVLTPEFLKHTGIVPTEWELACTPLCTNNLAQVTYTNGVNVVAEPSLIMFVEPILYKDLNSIQAPSVARKYLQTLPNAEYKTVRIIFKGYVTFDRQQSCNKYLTETLLNSGAWQSIGNENVRPGLNLSYSLDSCQLVLSINESRLRTIDETILPIVMFNGNFSYDLTDDTFALRLASMQQAIANWQADLTTYKEIVNTKFFGEVAQKTNERADLFRTGAAA